MFYRVGCRPLRRLGSLRPKQVSLASSVAALPASSEAGFTETRILRPTSRRNTSCRPLRRLGSLRHDGEDAVDRLVGVAGLFGGWVH